MLRPGQAARAGRRATPAARSSSLSGRSSSASNRGVRGPGSRIRCTKLARRGEVRGDQIEAEDAAVVDVDGARDDRRVRRGRLALAVGDGDDLGEPGGDVEVDVQPHRLARASPLGDLPPRRLKAQATSAATAKNEPSTARTWPSTSGSPDAGLGPVRRAVARGAGRRSGSSSAGSATRWKSESVLLGMRSTERNRCGLLGAAEVLDGAERAQGRVEEGQQVADQDVVEVKDAIAVGVLGPQGAEQRLEGADVLAADDESRARSGGRGRWAVSCLTRMREEARSRKCNQS